MGPRLAASGCPATLTLASPCVPDTLAYTACSQLPCRPPAATPAPSPAAAHPRCQGERGSMLPTNASITASEDEDDGSKSHLVAQPNIRPLRRWFRAVPAQMCNIHVPRPARIPRPAPLPLPFSGTLPSPFFFFSSPGNQFSPRLLRHTVHGACFGPAAIHPEQSLSSSLHALLCSCLCSCLCRCCLCVTWTQRSTYSRI